MNSSQKKTINEYLIIVMGVILLISAFMLMSTYSILIENGAGVSIQRELLFFNILAVLMMLTFLPPIVYFGFKDVECKAISCELSR